MAKKTKQESTYGSSVQPNYQTEDKITRLMRHYLWGVQDMDTRRGRKNGWNDVINAYMGKLPANWPYNSVVTDPVIRTTILEKTSRLLNAKLQGRLIPRDEDGDYIKAKINNALLDFQWDFANEGGSMLEKVALADQYARIFGAAFVLTYWDVTKDSNEIKLIDPRDLFFDGAATHVRNCKWVQVREFTSFDKLEQRGYDVSEARAMAEKGEITAELRSTRYESIVKANRGLVDRTGMIDDIENPVVEVVTEWGFDKDQNPYCLIFLPKYAMIIYDGPNPYKHGKIPLSMLRYYPLNDDLYGESEVESVLPIQRALNSMLCGFLDEANVKLKPPLKINSTGVRIETIEYGPGARWIMNNPDNVVELEPNGGFINTFNAVYPMLLTSFKAAMGDQSQFNQQLPTNANDNPTATQVIADEKMQNVRDQYNQLYLGEFLKDIMMQWVANNKQYLLDDPSKQYHILKIIGKDEIDELMSLGLADKDIPDYALEQIKDTIVQHPGAVSDQQLSQIVQDVSVPVHPIIKNPKEKNPENYEYTTKLEVGKYNKEASLYITPDDFEGEYDYIPDVRSMAAGAGLMAQQARQQAYNLVFQNPEVIQLLQTQGDMIKIKELLVNILEDAGERDADGLFEPLNQTQNGQGQGIAQQPGQTTFGPGQQPMQPNGAPGMGTVPQAVPPQPGAGGLSQPIGQGQGGQISVPGLR